MDTSTQLTRTPKAQLHGSRVAFAGLARLLAARAERDLPIDVRSLVGLLRVYRQILRGEAA